MGNLVLFMHVTLDGFVAGTSGEMDWIHVDEEIFEFAGDNTDRSDTALYGRVTYEMMDGYWPAAGQQPDASAHDIKHSNWYNSVKKVVVSRSLKELSKPNTQVIHSDLAAAVNELKAATDKNIVIFGSPGLSHSLMEHDLIDEYWLFVNPVLLGNGIRLFDKINQRIPLTLIARHSFSSGVVGLHYERVKLEK